MARGGADYLDDVSKDSGGNKKKLSNLQVDQDGMDESPVEGGEGFVGGAPNASSVGFAYITGKKGSTESRPIWGEQTDYTHSKTNSGSEDTTVTPAGSDSTDEKAPYKKVQTDEGLPQTFRTAEGAGDAGASGSDEPDQDGSFGRLGGMGSSSYSEDRNAQSVPSGATSGDTEIEMPMTDFTSREGGGAPLFKHSK